MSTVEKSIEIAVPVGTAYNQWTQFERFPAFMEGVEAVEQLDERRLRWRAELGGKRLEWNALITEQVPDKRIAWRSSEGSENSGVVDFQRISDQQCRVTLRIDYEPSGALETLGDALGAVGRRVTGDLERFKDFIEKRGTESGAWRGELANRGEPDSSRRSGGHLEEGKVGWLLLWLIGIPVPVLFGLYFLRGCT